MSGDPQVSGGSSNLFAKVIGGIFAMIIAPVVATIGSNVLQKKFEKQIDVAADVVAGAPVAVAPNTAGKSKATPPPVVAAKEADTKPPKPSEKKVDDTPKVVAAGPEPKPAEKPKATPLPVAESKGAVTKLARRGSFEKKAIPSTIHLVGKDLSPFTTFLGPPVGGLKPYGKDSDPERVFALRDGQLHVSGKVPGVLETMQDYENYRLTVEYRFGEKTWPPRETAPKLSGLLIHAPGANQGSPGTPGQWRIGYRVLISEDSVGGIILPAASDGSLSLTVEAEKAVNAKAKAGRVVYKYRPGAPAVTLTKGTIDRLGFSRGPALKGAGPEISPKALWNTLECVCDGDRLTVRLNGKAVNVATKLSRSKGKIGIISDGAEIVFRTIDLQPLARSRL